MQKAKRGLKWKECSQHQLMNVNSVSECMLEKSSTMNVRVAASAPTTPPETGASSKIGTSPAPMLSALATHYNHAAMSIQQKNGIHIQIMDTLRDVLELGESVQPPTLAASMRQVWGSMVDASISNDGRIALLRIPFRPLYTSST